MLHLTLQQERHTLHGNAVSWQAVWSEQCLGGDEDKNRILLDLRLFECLSVDEHAARVDQLVQRRLATPVDPCSSGGCM